MTQATVTGATGQTITVSTGTSLYSLTSTGTEYFLYNPTPTVVNMSGGSGTYTSADGSVSFTVTEGDIPFINGDFFTLDIFPHIGDIRLREDEYPELTEANFITRTSGGAGV